MRGGRALRGQAVSGVAPPDGGEVFVLEFGLKLRSGCDDDEDDADKDA